MNIKGPDDSFEESGQHLPENRKAKRLKHKGAISSAMNPPNTIAMHRLLT